MKTNCNIPVIFDDSLPIHLIVELGENGISLLWYTTSPLIIKGLKIYTFEPNDNNIATLKDILIRECNEKTKVSTVRVCFNYTQSLLVPEQYFKVELLPDMLTLLHGEQINSTTAYDFVKNGNLYNTYRVPLETVDLVKETFPSAKLVHSSSLLLARSYAQQTIRAIICYDTIKVLLYINGVIQFVQQFSFFTPEDALYHVVNTCQQHNIIASETQLILSGMIVKDSNLYNQFYNYFLDIEFEESALQITQSEEVENFPSHFFNHLIELATCEL